MIALKDYQVRVLDSLREFFILCSREGHPSIAFQRVQENNGRSVGPYHPVQAAGLADGMPYICLRVPTGGGKTLLACYASGLAMTHLLQAERAVVLWLVPSNTILDQTVDALRDANHPYRRALEMSCGAVEVITVEEALQVSLATVEAQTVVIVATIQSFRAEDTTGRKVYEQNGVFAEHLLHVPPLRLRDLLPGTGGQPVPSLVNMLRLRRPIVIVDEAHNARTELSFATLGSVLPACIIEFSATPVLQGATPSNILHRVSAAELKVAEMIKLPLRVVTRHPSQRAQLLAESIALRADLERLATSEGQRTGEYLRPILLIQAERVDACEPLRAQLVSEFGIPFDDVKISVGSLDELKDVRDLLEPTCGIRIIITVVKLREGWDCPFAYVLCNLRETRSAVAIEQIIGRILRLPGAKAKHHHDLNCAYALAVSPSITEVLADLRTALVGNGFTSAEAERNILPVAEATLPLGSQPQTMRIDPAEIDSNVAVEQSGVLEGKARIDVSTGEITVLIPLAESDEKRLLGAFVSYEAKRQVAALVQLVRETEVAFGGTGAPRAPSPYERGLDFVVPRLSVREANEVFEFESTLLLEHPWRLSSKDAGLPDTYNPIRRPVGQVGSIDVGGRGGGMQMEVLPERSETDFVGMLHQHAFALGDDHEWTVEGLVAWLDQRLDHQDIPIGESAEFLRQVIRGLMTRFGIHDLGVVALDRFRLREEVERRIRFHRELEQRAAFQLLLLPDSPLVVTRECAVNFQRMGYEPSEWYKGDFVFRKHYFGNRPGDLPERTADGGLREEFKCARFIDDMPEVRFWVRNLPQRETSFRLHTSKGWFYPDFVVQLENGRVLVVEYKGGHLLAGAEEKLAVGKVWESRSNGTCLFVMPTNGNFATISAAANR